MIPDLKKLGSREITIPLDELAYAYANCTDETRYILDLQAQEIILLSEYTNLKEEIDEFFEEIDCDITGRYIPFPVRFNSHDGYADIKGFIKEIPNQEIRDHAKDLILASRPFKRFREFIRKYPDLLEQWYAYREGREQERVEEWLKEEELVIGKQE